MANFFLIDHSLRQSGGHHFDYVSCVARAANELGFLTTIGANRSLKKLSANDHATIEQLGKVKRVFRHTTYQPDSYLAGLQHLTRSDCGAALREDENQGSLARLGSRFKTYFHRRRRESFINQFATDCQKYFESQMQTEGDHAFLTTVSELELMGLSAYLSRHPQSIQTHWHLQFHFNLFDGRTPEYVGQEYIAEAIRGCFLTALTKLSYHRIHFYTTSETLADQYNRLGVGDFHVLPYPVSPAFASGPYPDDSFGVSDRPFDEGDLANAILNSNQSNLLPIRPTPLPSNDVLHSDDCGIQAHQSDFQERSSDEIGERPIRITCPGEVRREKGHVDYLQPLVDEIYDTHLSTGNVEVVVQRPARKWPAKKEKIDLQLPEEFDENSQQRSPIKYFSHPLSQKDYIELIKTTDCGLLFYDSRVYFSRRAGVLGELLSCGKPVIVPAGSWLAEQIQEPIFQHVEGLIEQGQAIRMISSNEFKWNSRNAPAAGGVLSFDQAAHPFEFKLECEDNENFFTLTFDWHWPESQGIYCRIDVCQMDQDEKQIDFSSRVVGYRQGLGKVNALFQLAPQTSSIHVSLTNAFHDSTASIKCVSATTFSSIAGSTQDVPIGQIGVVACDQNDLPNCVDEIVRHFDHYRQTARDFSPAWYARHEPRRTVGHLVSVGQSIPRAA